MLLKDLTTGEIKDMIGGVSIKDIKKIKDMDSKGSIGAIKKGVLEGHPDVDLVKIFSDDPLRMIRLIRFKVKYNWSIPEEVKQITRDNAYRLNIVSSERIRDELIKVMEQGKLKEAIELAKDLGFDKVEVKVDIDDDGEPEELNALSFLLNELKPLEMRHDSPHHIDTEDKKDDKIIDHTNNVLAQAQLKKTVEGQLAALLHDIGKPKTRTEDGGKVQFIKHEIEGLEIAEQILRKFKLKKKQIDDILFIIKNHMRPHQIENAEDRTLRKFIDEMGDRLESVLDIAEADSEGKNPPKSYMNKLRNRIKDIQKKDAQSLSTKPMHNGNEIMELLGIEKKGKGKGNPEVGKVIKFLREERFKNPNITKEEEKQMILDNFS
jgi:poly(A) polymerase